MLHLNAGFDAREPTCQVTGVITENFVGVVHGSKTKRFDSSSKLPKNGRC